MKKGVKVYLIFILSVILILNNFQVVSSAEGKRLLENIVDSCTDPYFGSTDEELIKAIERLIKQIDDECTIELLFKCPNPTQITTTKEKMLYDQCTKNANKLRMRKETLTKALSLLKGGQRGLAIKAIGGTVGIFLICSNALGLTNPTVLGNEEWCIKYRDIEPGNDFECERAFAIFLNLANLYEKMRFKKENICSLSEEDNRKIGRELAKLRIRLGEIERSLANYCKIDIDPLEESIIVVKKPNPSESDPDANTMKQALKNIVEKIRKEFAPDCSCIFSTSGSIASTDHCNIECDSIRCEDECNFVFCGDYSSGGSSDDDFLGGDIFGGGDSDDSGDGLTGGFFSLTIKSIFIFILFLFAAVIIGRFIILRKTAKKPLKKYSKKK